MQTFIINNKIKLSIVLLIIITMLYIFLSNKSIYLKIDNSIFKVNTRQLFTKELIKKEMTKRGYDNYKIVNNYDNITLLNNKTIEIITEKEVSLLLVNEKKVLKTYKLYVKDFLLENNIINNDYINYVVNNTEEDSVLENNSTLEVHEIRKETETEIVSYDLDIVYNNNASINEGVSNVISEGIKKEIKYTYNYEYKNNELVSKTLISEEVINEGSPKVIEVGTKKKVVVPTTPVVLSDDTSVWDNLSYCESGGRWNLNSNNGYYGGLQFSYSTWLKASRAVNLDIEYAHLATREEQILAATWLQQNSGWGQWGACSKKLGLY